MKTTETSQPMPDNTPDTNPSVMRQFYELTKPRVIQLIVFCALIGMVLAVPAAPTWAQVQLAALACLGIWLVAGAAAAFNCIVEQGIDAKMKRTAWRPTARGELSNTQTLLFSAVLGVLGSAVLYFWVNPLTMWLTFATFVGYAVIYTVILKPLTPQNIVIGGASGAMPPVLGWAAMTGKVGPEAPEALILFLIIFLWTPPHFWALALYRVEDYRKSGLPMLPVTPPILENLKKKHPSFYDDIMDEVDEYDVDDLSHEALCKDTIAGDDGRQIDLLHFIIQKQVEEYDDLIWAFEHLDKIQSKIVEVKDERLIDLMQRDKTSRAREDLSRSFFRTLSELRKHQHWRYQRDAVDVSPSVDEDN